MFPTIRLLAVLILLSTILAGCGTTEPQSSSEITTEYNKKLKDDKKPRLQKYVAQQRLSQADLTLPPDLVETANETVTANLEAALRPQVLPEVVGAKIIIDEGRRWLEVEADAEQVWNKIVNYWAEEQITLTVFNPTAGIMETDWIENTIIAGDGSSQAMNVAKQLFNRVIGQGVAHDRYAIRLERAGNDLTRVYVSHRATVKKASETQAEKKLSSFEWVQVADDPEKVAEILQIMVLLFDSSALDATS